MDTLDKVPFSGTMTQDHARLYYDFGFGFRCYTPMRQFGLNSIISWSISIMLSLQIG